MKRFHFRDLHAVDVRHIGKRLFSSLTEGWYVKGDPGSENRKRLLISTYNINIFSGFITGSFWAGLLLLLNADDGFIGLMSMVGTAANMLQLFAPLLLERFARRKKMILWLRSIALLINIVFIGLIPMFPASHQMSLTMTMIAVLIVNLISAFNAPAVNIWQLQSLPPNVRTSYFSLITMTAGAIASCANLLGSWLVDIFKANGAEYYGLLALRAVALALAAYDIFLWSKVTELPYESAGEKRPSMVQLLIHPFREKLYLRTVGVAVLWSFAANIPGMYYTVYLLDELKTPYTYLTLVSFMYVPIVLFLTPVWRKILQKFSWFKTLYIAMGLYAIYYVGLALVTPSTLWLYPVSVVWAFLMAVGINLSFTSIPYVNIPEKNQTMSIGFYSTMANLAALAGIWLGREFVLNMEEVRVTVLGVVMGNRQLLVLGAGGMIALAALGIYFLQRKIPRPEN